MSGTPAVVSRLVTCPCCRDTLEVRVPEGDVTRFTGECTRTDTDCWPWTTEDRLKVIAQLKGAA